jgi:hypothetical protein
MEEALPLYYLCAIALQTGRGKDLTRVGVFFDQDAVDRDALASAPLRSG